MNGTKHSRGCLIIVNKNLDLKILNKDVDVNGRYILIHVEMKGEEFYNLNVYFPNSANERVNYLKKTYKYNEYI